jgi:broad specificity phosphatase PhoE
MAATKIMIIRHAERPSEDDSVVGVTMEGKKEPEELTVRGWQRAGAMIRFFAPAGGHFADPHLASPDIIFASKVEHHSPSYRAQHTVKPLADFLHKQVVLTHAKGEEKALVDDAIAANGTVLIAWEHEAIPEMGNMIVGNNTTCPQKWHGSRFDLVWVFDRPRGSGGWTFAEVPQLLLPGDSPEVGGKGN